MYGNGVSLYVGNGILVGFICGPVVGPGVGLGVGWPPETLDGLGVGEPFGSGVGEIVLGPSPFRGCFVGGVPPEIPVGLGVGEASGPADGPGVGEPFGPGVGPGVG